MKINQFLIISGLFCIIYSCNINKSTHLSNTKSSNINHRIAGIYQGACFGKCPVFGMDLWTDSTLTLNGIANIEYLGDYKYKLSTIEYSRFNLLLSKIKIENLLNKYSKDIEDIASTDYIFYTSQNIIRKQVFTKGDSPEELKNLSDFFSSFINKSGWIKHSSQLDAPKNEVIISLKENTELDEIISKYTRYGLKIKDHLSKSLPIYLCEFNENSITLPIFINLLKTDSSIQSVEKNAYIQLRN